MTCGKVARRLADSRGQTLVEFAFVAFLLIMVTLSVIEFSRMVLVYTTVANAARAGSRYAIVHGTDSAVTSSQVQTYVTNFLAAAPMQSSIPPVSVSVTGAGGAVGTTVTVVVTYPYDPFTTYFPFSVNLSSTSQGVITF